MNELQTAAAPRARHGIFRSRRRLPKIPLALCECFNSKFTVCKKRLIHAGFYDRINWREIFDA